MRSKKVLPVWSLALATSLGAASSVSLLAKPPKPEPPIPVTATYRDAVGDALRSDGGGPYAATVTADGSQLRVSGPSCYFETTLFDDGGDCLEGNLPDEFSMCGAGELVVMPQWESFFAMSPGDTQPAVYAKARVIGDDNFRYFVRFWPTDTLISEPNCSTTVTITRLADHWEIEGFADDVARVLTNKIRGGGGYTNRGHYLAPFQISVWP